MSFTLRLAAFFKAHPHEWLDGYQLGEVAGRYAWRSRVSDCRRDLGMTIENRERKEHQLKCAVNLPQGSFGEPYECSCRRYTVSEYRYIPPADAEPPLLRGHDINNWSLR